MEVKRGQVWYVGFGDSVGSEQTAGRPAVIVSSEYGCETNQVISVVFLTSSPNKFRNTVHPTITSTPRNGVALCEQVTSVDKSRLKNYICDVYPEELEGIASGLRLTLGLEPSTDAFKEMAQEYEEKIENLDEKIESLEDAWCSWKTEADTYKRLYEKALEKLADAREQSLPVKKLPEVKVLPKVEVVLDTQIEGPKKLVDINRCGEDELAKLNLASHVIAGIIANRPYVVKEDLKKVPAVTAIMYQLIQHEITVGDTAEFRKPKKKPEAEVVIPVAEEKKVVNINTAIGAEFKAAGVASPVYYYKIVNYRKEHGPYASVDALWELGVMTQAWVNKYRDMLTVGEVAPVVEETEPEPQPEQEQPLPKKLNLNEASVRDLMRLGFGKSEAAKIYNHRKRNGGYHVVEDLLRIDGVTAKVLRKVRDRLEV